MTVLAPFEPCRARRGIVCSADHLATTAGVGALADGGSAADAAVAAAAVLAVTSQHLCGMGGDLLAMVHQPGEGPLALNASGRAGSGADPGRLRDEGHAVMPFRGDLRSVTAPGCVDGWLALHERFGRLELQRVLAPAIRHAEDGFPAAPLLAAAVALVADVPHADDYRVPGGVRTGAPIRRPGLARALRAIASHGRSAWYEGELAERLAGMSDDLTEDDLRRPHADWVTPLRVRAWGHDIATPPPNSQGYLTLASAWIADGLDLPREPGDERWAHLLVEAARQAGHDRTDVLHEQCDGAALLAPERLRPRRDAISPERTARLGGRYAGGGTTHLVAVDGDRLAVSLTQSNAADWGAHVVVPGIGVFLHNRGIGFSLQPGHPAELRPGRRPPHTLSPAVVATPDGSLAAALGTMSGDSQPQVLLQLLARLLHAGEDPAGALAAGRWVLRGEGDFRTWADGGPVALLVEEHADERWAPGLRRRGHPVETAPAWSLPFGHAHVALDAGSHLAGAADPRCRTGAAAGL